MPEWAAKAAGSVHVDPGDLQGQDEPGFKLTCDDPGSVEEGDITYCRGTNEGGVKATVTFTFQSEGGYSWEAM